MKIPLGDVLRLAADRHLATCQRDIKGWDTERFSCLAARDASCFLGVDRMEAQLFLRALGCDTNSYKQFTEFEEYRYRPGFAFNIVTSRSQGARFLWLDFAALVADDMGLTVEVE